jgi:hypothetical protein
MWYLVGDVGGIRTNEGFAKLFAKTLNPKPMAIQGTKEVRKGCKKAKVSPTSNACLMIWWFHGDLRAEVNGVNFWSFFKSEEEASRLLLKLTRVGKERMLWEGEKFLGQKFIHKTDFYDEVGAEDLG